MRTHRKRQGTIMSSSFSSIRSTTTITSTLCAIAFSCCYQESPKAPRSHCSLRSPYHHYNKSFTGDNIEVYFSEQAFPVFLTVKTNNFQPRPLDNPAYPGKEPNSQSFLDVQRTMLSLKADAKATVHGERARYGSKSGNKLRRSSRETISTP
jgi:hypothetical protein